MVYASREKKRCLPLVLYVVRCFSGESNFELSEEFQNARFLSIEGAWLTLFLM